MEPIYEAIKKIPTMRQVSVLRSEIKRVFHILYSKIENGNPE